MLFNQKYMCIYTYMFLRYLHSTQNTLRRRSFSLCHFQSNGMISPFFASMMWGGLFTYIILDRMHSNDTQLFTKLNELEKEVHHMRKK